MVDPVSALRALGGDVTAGATGLPNIPQVPASADPAMTNILSVMKTWMEKASGAGITGFASKQELLAAGVISQDQSGNIVGQNDMRAPPVPTGLAANGAMTNILVQWDAPTDKYSYHAYTEVWAAEVDDYSLAVMVGQAGAFVFSHAVGEDSTRYYWIRFVSISGIKGPFNSVAGTHGQTAKNVNYLIDTLTDAYGTNGVAPFFQVDTQIVVNGVTIPPGTYIKAAFIANGSIVNAQIKNAAIDSAKIADASITSAKIADASITSAKIADASITSAKIVDASIGAAKISSISLVGNVFNVKSGGSGGRMEMTSDVIKVYDSSGVLRVKLGNLDV